VLWESLTSPRTRKVCLYFYIFRGECLFLFLVKVPKRNLKNNYYYGCDVALEAFTRATESLGSNRVGAVTSSLVRKQLHVALTPVALLIDPGVCVCVCVCARVCACVCVYVPCYIKN